MSDFTDYIVESLSDLNGEIHAKRMFGGHGIFHNNLIFALIADDQLYFKTNDKIASLYKRKGLSPFTYTRKEKDVSLSYYEGPESAIDDIQELKNWAQMSINILDK